MFFYCQFRVQKDARITDDTAWLNVIMLRSLKLEVPMFDLTRLKRDQNQIISVLSEFSRSVCKANHLATFEIKLVTDGL